ncbi:50S ribosome-binding GTPase [Musa troglodytarum]|uniref:50S ribosome-binding GTPase n=1 Tax=Musa troglodytarum TaxID=320322 RepID=A0A9E7ENA8_9LILI|nr:50S ribosome-binding GTPase [Musa troglodytarum]
MATLASFSSRLGAVVRELASKKGPGGWYSRHMAAAERAILDRIPLVDLVVEVRDARIPSTSAFECLRKACCSHKQVIVLNKLDLADNFLTERWLKHFKNQNYITYGLNAHNKDSIKEIASHPNLYVLDSPGILRLKIAHNEMGAKLALTGAMEDFLIGEYDLARYFLAILNLSEEYKRWEKLKDTLDDTLSSVSLEKHVVGRDTIQRKLRQYPSDHTQDFIVKDVRQTLFKIISSFEGHLEKENDMEKIIESQFIALQEALKVSSESSEDRYKAVAVKLLNLYRTGRLGCYTLDLVSSEV